MTFNTEKMKQIVKDAPWPGILLFAALLAQAPHAAWVFLRIAPPHELWWEAGIAIIGAVVYAIALEGATAFFVWKDSRWLAGGFATFSFAHNFVYYMPAAWSVEWFGATLTVRYILSALLISASLPVAIAAFSHVQVDAKRDKRTAKPAANPSKADAKTEETPAKPVAKQTFVANGAEVRRDAILAHMRNGWGGERSAASIVDAIAVEFGAATSTVYRDLQKLEADGAIERDAAGTVRLSVGVDGSLD